MKVIAYIEGKSSYNQKEHKARTYGSFVVFNTRGDKMRYSGFELTDLDIKTINEAEYLSLIRCLKWCISRNHQPIVYINSQLIIKQLIGEYKVGSIRLKRLYKETCSLLEWLPFTTINWVPRQEIKKKLRF